MISEDASKARGVRRRRNTRRKTPRVESGIKSTGNPGKTGEARKVWGTGNPRNRRPAFGGVFADEVKRLFDMLCKSSGVLSGIAAAVMPEIPKMLKEIGATRWPHL